MEKLKPKTVSELSDEEGHDSNEPESPNINQSEDPDKSNLESQHTSHPDCADQDAPITRDYDKSDPDTCDSVISNPDIRFPGITNLDYIYNRIPHKLIRDINESDGPCSDCEMVPCECVSAF